MQQSGVSARNIACMITMVSLCTVLMFGFGTNGQDMWLSVIAAVIINLPLILLFARIARVNPGLDLFDIICHHFGRVTGSILTALLSWYALHVSTLSARNFTEFVATISLKTTPKIFIIIGLIVVAGILASCKPEIMARWSLIVFIAVFTNLVLTILAALPALHFSYLKPVMEHSLGEILSTGFSLGSIAYGETLLVLAVIGSLRPGEKPLKAYLLGIGWATILILMVVLRNIMVLGRVMVTSSVFPSFIAARVISPGSFVEHVESIVSFNLILLGITKVSVCLRAASVGVAKILKIEDMEKKCIVPMCLLSIALCAISFTNFQELIAFVEAYRFYALPFTLLIPAIIWVKSEIGRAKNKV
jgi:spore germination protein KB